MPKGYRPYLPDQDLLLPPSLRDWLPEDHLVYFVSDVVDQLDLSAIHAWYGEEKRGQPPYDPVLMTKLLVYGYCTGVFSSRRLQKGIQEDIPFKVLAAGNEPDFRTISDFRKIHLVALEGLFEGKSTPPAISRKPEASCMRSSARTSQTHWLPHL